MTHKFNRDPQDIPESRRLPNLTGMAGGERVGGLDPQTDNKGCAHGWRGNTTDDD
jgi:hypothetical protein